MPLTSPTSYIISVPLFLNHWEDAGPVVEGITGDDLVLDKDACGQATDVTRDTLAGLYDELVALRDTLEDTLLDLGLARAICLQHKTALHGWLLKFNQSMRADHSTTHFIRSLALVPQLGDGEENFCKPMRLTAKLWTKINAWRAAQVPPRPALTLPDGTTQGQFFTKLTALTAQYDAVEERDQQAGLDRGLRNDLQDKIYPICKVYRLKVEACLPAGHALISTLPALTEVAGATPLPGTLAGSYNSQTGMAELTGTASPSPNVVKHQLRASTAPVPSVDDEGLRAEFDPGQPIALTTHYGLTEPGAVVHFRLVAITAGGNEKGSPWVSIQRPVP